MRLLFVQAHPVPESFCAALCRAAMDEAGARGHAVRLIDLHACGFDPVLRAAEHRSYADPAQLPADLAPHVEALRWAEGVIFVYPTWWQAQPAILKGWLDRVWRPGVAFTAPPGGGLRPGLPHVRLIGAITTLGAPWWVWTLLMGAPGRKMLLRGLRACTAPRTRSFWLALHDIDTRPEADRRRYLDRVRARVARIPV